MITPRQILSCKVFVDQWVGFQVMYICIVICLSSMCMLGILLCPFFDPIK